MRVLTWHESLPPSAYPAHSMFSETSPPYHNGWLHVSVSMIGTLTCCSCVFVIIATEKSKTVQKIIVETNIHKTNLFVCLFIKATVSFR